MRIVLKRKMYANPFSKAERMKRMDQKTLQELAQKELDEFRPVVVEQYDRAKRVTDSLNIASRNLEMKMEDAKYRRDNRESGGSTVFGSSKMNRFATNRDARALNKERNRVSHKRDIYNEEMDIYNDMLDKIEEGKSKIQQHKRGRGNYLLRGYDRVYNTWDSGKVGKAKVIIGGSLAAAGLGAGIYYGNKALKKRKEQRRLEKLDEALYSPEGGLEEKEFSFLGSFGKEGRSARKTIKDRIKKNRGLIDKDTKLSKSQYEALLNLADEKEAKTAQVFKKLHEAKDLRNSRISELKKDSRDADWYGKLYKPANKGTREYTQDEIGRRLDIAYKHAAEDAAEINKGRKSINYYRDLEKAESKKYQNTLNRIKKSEKQLASDLSEQGNVLERGYDYIADTWDSGNSGKAKVIIGGTLAASGLTAGGYCGYKALKKKRDRKKAERLNKALEEIED